MQNCFSNDAIPPHDHAGYRENRWCESDNHPRNFERKDKVWPDAAESAEVQTRKPEQDVINRARHRPGIVERLYVIDDGLDPLLEDEICAADRKHKNNDDRPEADGAVQVPVKTLPADS